MTESIPVSLVEDWINDLQSILKQESQEAETPTDLLINKGMRHGIAQIRGNITTWRRHQKYAETLRRSGRKFLMTRRVNLSDGSYRNLEWYQDDHFVTLAWRHAKDAETGELMLEMQDVQHLSTTYLLYKGKLSYDEMVRIAREGGLDAVKNEEADWRKWD